MYSKEKLCEELGKVDWTCERDDPQSYYDWLENEMLKVIDSVIPYKLNKTNYRYNSENAKTQNLVRKKKKSVEKLEKDWKSATKKEC